MQSEHAGTGGEPAILTGVVERVLFERPETGYRVLLVTMVGGARSAVVVGTLPEAGPGELIRAEGAWYDDRSWGRQFRASRATLEAPATEAGLVAYLSSGRIKGVGEELAKRLVTQFGMRLGEVIEREPLRLREIEGVGPRLAGRLQEAWQGQRRARDTLIFLSEHGFSAARANRIVETYGLDAIQTIRQDPYALARDIRGIGFATADQVALKLGIAPDSVQRIGAAMAEVLRLAADAGDTAQPRAEASAGLGRLLTAAPEQVAQAIDRECAAGRLVQHDVEHAPSLMLGELDRAERLIADVPFVKSARVTVGLPAGSGSRAPRRRCPQPPPVRPRAPQHAGSPRDHLAMVRSSRGALWARSSSDTKGPSFSATIFAGMKVVSGVCWPAGSRPTRKLAGCSRPSRAASPADSQDFANPPPLRLRWESSSSVSSASTTGHG